MALKRADWALKFGMASETRKRAVCPAGEWISHTLWSTLRKRPQQIVPATRLTQSRRRASKGGDASGPKPKIVRPPHFCRNCGQPLKNRKNRTCGVCAVADSRQNLLEAAKLGRIITHLPKAQALRAATQRRQAAALKVWKQSGAAAHMTDDAYRQTILPHLKNLPVTAISNALGVSQPYATNIRRGRCLPHPRHWNVLASLMP